MPCKCVNEICLRKYGIGFHPEHMVQLSISASRPSQYSKLPSQHQRARDAAKEEEENRLHNIGTRIQKHIPNISFLFNTD